MTFTHIPFSFPDIQEAHEDNRHFYLYEGEKFPSITTILHSRPNPGIDYWKSKTPNWREIQEESFQVGTQFHKKIEDYLNNKEMTYDDSLVSKLFENSLGELEGINNIRCLEKSLVNPTLKIAGKTDCIAEFDDVPSIIDFKNSRKNKNKYMEKSGYFEQVTAYSTMWEHMTGEKIDQGVIIIADWEGGINTHMVDINKYKQRLYDIIREYYD